MKLRAIVFLILADLVVILLVTLSGFATHATLGSAGIRILAVWLPLSAAWLVTAPFLGVYDPRNTGQYRQLWRPFWAMVLAAPLGSILRGFWLNSPVMPIFVVVLGGVAAISILAWRIIFWFFGQRSNLRYG